MTETSAPTDTVPAEAEPTWLAAPARARIAEIEAGLAGRDAAGLAAEIERLVAADEALRARHSINLDPAANVMNPAAEALMARGLSGRPSLGHPGTKYEAGLEEIEQIEVIASRLARQVFGARFAEIRLGSGAMANLAAFMAVCRPGDAVIVPPASVGGHVTHHLPGAAGLYGLKVHAAPVNPQTYSVDPEGVAALAARVGPRLITIGGSLNLGHHPVAELAAIAREHGARLMFDAAHLSGPIAGGAWPDPLSEGADLMTLSTYKSLGGPPGGLVLTNDPGLAGRIDAIAFPGLTANPDPGRIAALARTLLDWVAFGPEAAREMVAAARTLAAELYRHGLPVAFAGDDATRSHALALQAARWGGGAAMAARLRRAGLLACPIGLPDGRDGVAEGLRIGTSEISRRGMGVEEMGALAELIARALEGDPAAVAPDVGRLAARHDRLRHVLP
ncbi:serine hydroxymethyltransferase [Paralimibaculum aggregatum]|uniref:Serine hydroxymethyltransferase n=1 Tax=Paralimibaculum aggregatum TaxID=3036245 RepID=A0ABQ6LCA9_9RHOB|nr:beta-eliminating lyase-related protein [Limibaculum sp. NKW23]GMG81001.1 serine hydroxymethyltransferase [Limibaculum sp. NKW23]